MLSLFEFRDKDGHIIKFLKDKNGPKRETGYGTKIKEKLCLKRLKQGLKSKNLNERQWLKNNNKKLKNYWIVYLFKITNLAGQILKRKIKSFIYVKC